MVNVNNIKKYDKMIYDSSFVNVQAYTDEKLDNVHQKLFFDALEKAFEDLKISEDTIICSDLNIEPNELQDLTLEEFMQEYKIKEIKKNEYFKPSTVIFRKLTYPMTTFFIDLTKYWDEFQYSIVDKKPADKLNAVEDLDQATIIYIDYVNGKSKLRSRLSGDEFWISNEYLNSDVKLHDEYTLENTFTKKLKNLQ